MFKKNVLPFLFIACLFASCGTSQKTSVLQVSTPISNETPVEIIGIGQKVMDGSKLLGQIKIGDSGFTTNCSYPVVIAEAQKQARALGGNLIQIIEHKEPSMMSTCHRLKCDVYKSEKK